jgi:hypothetical protein
LGSNSVVATPYLSEDVIRACKRVEPRLNEDVLRGLSERDQTMLSRLAANHLADALSGCLRVLAETNPGLLPSSRLIK